MNWYICILLFSTLVLTVVSNEAANNQVKDIIKENLKEKIFEKYLSGITDDEKLKVLDELELNEKELNELELNEEEEEDDDNQVTHRVTWTRWTPNPAPAGARVTHRVTWTRWTPNPAPAGARVTHRVTWTRWTPNPAPAPPVAPRPSGGSGGSGGSPSADKGSCLTKHNFYRRRHRDTPDLVWDNNLAKGAQEYADYLRDNNKWEHSKGLSAQLGENLAKSSGYPLAGACDRAITSWYNEINEYNFNNPGFSGATGHFTQVVWKSTTKVGVGIATNGQTIWVVGRYSPAGNMNMPGYFAQNVQPLKY